MNSNNSLCSHSSRLTSYPQREWPRTSCEEYEYWCNIRAMMQIQTWQQAFSPLPRDSRPCILFRLEHPENSSFTSNGDMVSRNPLMALNRAAFDNHLSWEHRGSPLRSFFRTWERIIARMRWLINRGTAVEEIILLAVWSKDLPGVYDAYDVASQLEYNDGSSDHRKRLNVHRDEFLVSPGICAEDYRILAIFQASSIETYLNFAIPGLQSRARVPSTFARTILAAPNLSTQGEKATYELQMEMYSHTGVEDPRKLYALVLSICGESYSWESKGGITTITNYTSGIPIIQRRFQIP